MRKNKFGNRRNWIETDDNKILLKLQFTLEVSVYRRRFLKKSLNSMDPFDEQDWHVLRSYTTTGL